MKKSFTFSIVFTVEVLALFIIYFFYSRIENKQNPIIETSKQEQVITTPDKTDFTYEVKAGDSIWSIARTFKVSVKAILEKNNLQKSAILSVGQKIIIPKKNTVLQIQNQG